MKIQSITDRHDAPAGAFPRPEPRLAPVNRLLSDLARLVDLAVDQVRTGIEGFTGEVCQGAMATGIAIIGNPMTGRQAHAAVRMHVSPATTGFWSYGKKPAGPHFQRWKRVM